jgi:D-alanine-D-alanine ligase
MMSVCLHKGLTKAVIREAGVPTPRSVVTGCLDDVQRVELEYPLFVKPVAEGTGKGVTVNSRVASSTELAAQCQRLLAEYRQPVLVEEFLGGREFTVGILGTADQAQVLGTLEITLRQDAEPGVYSYINKERCEELVEYRLVLAEQDELVRDAEEIALRAWRALGCRDGGRIDLRADGRGRPQFLEANPLAGLHPHHSDLPMLATALGMSYVELIGRIVDSAAQRVPSTASSSPRVLPVS